MDKGYFPGKTIFESGTVTGHKNQANDFKVESGGAGEQKPVSDVKAESRKQVKDYLAMQPRVFFSKDNLKSFGVEGEIATRIYNVMNNVESGTMSEFCERFKTQEDLLRIRFLGRKSLNRVVRVLKEAGIADIK